MANLLKITRGDRNYVSGFFDGTGLADGQLFWQMTNKESDSNNPWDEGTLYIGRPDLKNSAPLAIGGPRATKSLIFRGYITGSTLKSDPIFAHASTGDFWMFSSNVRDSANPDPDFLTWDFRTDDIILVVDSKVNSKTGIATEITFARINNSGGSASNSYFDNTGTNFTATNTSDALKELESEKLSYRGAIYSQTDALLVSPEIGTLYLVGVDGLVVPTFDAARTSTQNLTGPSGRPLKKGDFIYHLKDSLNGTPIWYLIPSGYTDATDIDYHTSGVAADGMNETFNADHVSAIRSLTNVDQALAFLLQQKAQIDATGKIPLSQLPATVLGSLQYLGTWDPLLEITYPSAELSQHYNEAGYQAAWPIDGAGTVSDGDYYIVQTTNSYPNIQYSDKSSVLNAGQYSRVVELNAGDWVVWTNSPVDGDGTAGRWEKIDNSDRISVINFGINAVNTGSVDPHPVTEYTVGRVGSPKIKADFKLGLYEHPDGSVVISGMRLLDQSRDDNAGVGKSNFLPRYELYNDPSGAKNTLENSNIEDSAASGTVVHHNLQVGTATASFTETVYGDVKILPDTYLVDGVPTRTRNGVVIATPRDPIVDNTLNWLTTVLSSAAAAADITVTLPELESVVIGKRPTVALLPRRLTKSIRDGYIMSTSIEEHTVTDSTDVDSNEAATIVEIHAPTMNVENVGLRHLVFGKRSNLGTGFNADGSMTDSFLAEIFAHSEMTSNVTLVLPYRPGVLLNSADWAEFIDGSENTLALFGPIGADNKRKVVNSQIKQVSDAILLAFKKGLGNEIDEVGSTDKSFVDEFLPVSADETIDSRSKNVEIDQDVLIGNLNKTTDGLAKRGLHVTKFIGLGNGETNNTFFVPGRKLFPGSNQYKDPFTYKALPIETVYVEPPAVSGVMLTDNSVIDGGVYGYDVENPTTSLNDTPIGG